MILFLCFGFGGLLLAFLPLYWCLLVPKSIHYQGLLFGAAWIGALISSSSIIWLFLTSVFPYTWGLPPKWYGCPTESQKRSENDVLSHRSLVGLVVGVTIPMLLRSGSTNMQNFEEMGISKGVVVGIGAKEVKINSLSFEIIKIDLLNFPGWESIKRYCSTWGQRSSKIQSVVFNGSIFGAERLGAWQNALSAKLKRNYSTALCRYASNATPTSRL